MHVQYTCLYSTRAHDRARRGVAWHERSQRWEVRVLVGSKQKFICSSALEVDAARAYDKAVLRLRGQVRERVACVLRAVTATFSNSNPHLHADMRSCSAACTLHARTGRTQPYALKLPTF